MLSEFPEHTLHFKIPYVGLFTVEQLVGDYRFHVKVLQLDLVINAKGQKCCYQFYRFE